LRAARLLGTADRLILDGDVPAAILARARADAERIPLANARLEEPYNGQTVVVHFEQGDAG